jgi:site-specific DNA recombinase
MKPEMVKIFVDEFYREVNRQASERDAHRDCARRDLAKTEREISRLIEAIKAGVSGGAVKDEMTALEARRSDLLDQLKAAPPPIPRLHPNVAAEYREKILSLREALNAEGTRVEAAECIRGLIEEIRLVPEKGRLRIELFGQLAALINLTNQHPRSGGTRVSATLVAGARNYLNLLFDAPDLGRSDAFMAF